MSVDVLEILAPCAEKHRQLFVFRTKDLVSPDALGAAVVVGPGGEGLGVLDLTGKKVVITVEGPDRGVSMRWAADSGLQVPSHPAERGFMDWTPSARSLGTPKVVVADPSRDPESVSCRCVLPGGSLENSRLDHEYDDPSDIHIWEFADGSKKAVSDRLLLVSEMSDGVGVKVEIAADRLVINSRTGATRCMITNDFVSARPHGSEVEELSHLGMLASLTRGPVSAPTLQGAQRSDFPTCPGAFFTEKF